ncbi:MAG: proliferating cell nuclear antigen (pcna) [Phycisphaerales bacterium]|nr:proliferating cell nuclear antigen (pcna) [Phycisphaerales bacterium]
MKLTLAEPGLLKDSIAIISDLVTEAQFRITQNGMELIAMDPANVAMVIFNLLSSSFVEYNVKQEQLIALNLNDLKQVLRRAGTNDSLTLELEEEKLKVTMKGNATRTFHLPLISTEESEQKVPDLKFSAVIELEGNTFNQGVEDADIVAESVSLKAEPKIFTIAAAGDLSKASMEIPADDHTKINATEESRSKYSTEYLKKIMQGSKLSDTVKVQFSNDYPLKLEYLQKNKVQLAFILAPRVEND